MTRALFVFAFVSLLVVFIGVCFQTHILKEKLELSEDISVLQNEKILLLEQYVELEKDRNIQLNSLLIVYMENDKVHSSRLQDANWRLIQLKRLIEDGKKD